jgi:hypothetical protein
MILSNQIFTKKNALSKGTIYNYFMTMTLYTNLKSVLILPFAFLELERKKINQLVLLS